MYNGVELQLGFLVLSWPPKNFHSIVGGIVCLPYRSENLFFWYVIGKNG